MKKPDFFEQLKMLQETKEFHESMEQRQSSIKHYLKVDHPIGIIQVADIHMGARGVDYEKIMEFTDFVTKWRKYFRLGFLGDHYDNFLHFKSLRGAQESIEPPPMQIQTVVDMFKYFDAMDMLMYIVLGNHEIDREERAVGYSILKKALPEKIAKKVFECTGEVLIKIGPNKKKYIEYRGVVDHKGRGNSKKNPCHATMELIRDYNYPDWGSSAHTHRPGVMQYSESGRELTAIKCGTFKIRDIHSERYFTRGVYGTPVVVFDPFAKKTRGFYEPMDALRYMIGYDNELLDE